MESVDAPDTYDTATRPRGMPSFCLKHLALTRCAESPFSRWNAIKHARREYSGPTDVEDEFYFARPRYNNRDRHITYQGLVVFAATRNHQFLRYHIDIYLI